ncbi:GGDEF domain-containing protein [Marinospirillum alkaliphilum]|uniref:diguanylate cyclase n=1 Tax=Marinospirillum alkaliphilum DSM 21637 TaxID=1122209 RepID=A0A1K1Y3J1_9GAMM|nr:GGDEF domain-containing protein [Marinospirillum alkaliphilum]SFX56455.1 diguanylate cyclase (GGDEF) domain-containing protein [Marinospirillum alkaliphilum DSM 21637]
MRKSPGLTGRTLLLTLLTTAVSLAAILLALFSFSQYRNTITHLSQQQINTLLTATRLVQQTEGLMGSSALLLQAENHFNRRRAMFEIADRKEWIGRMVAELESNLDGGEAFARIYQVRDQLIDNLTKVDQLVAQRINLRADVFHGESSDPDRLQSLQLIEAEIGELLRENRRLATELSVAVGFHVSAIRSEIQDSVQQVNSAIATREGLLLVAAVIALLLMLTTVFYINRSVVRRVVALQKALSQDRLLPADIPVGGRDEITWMAQSIQRYVDKINLHEARILSMNRELEFMATHDALTRLSNRHQFERDLERLERDVGKHQVCAVMVDIDHFKQVNDRFGHDAGDQVIIGFASRLQEALPDQVLLARYGGEEFAMLFPDTPLDGVVRHLEQVRQQIERLPFELGGQLLTITASFGVAACGVGDLSGCMKRADQALYQAKASGRNRVVAAMAECQEGQA